MKSFIKNYFMMMSVLFFLFHSDFVLGAGWVTPTGNVDGTGWSNGNRARDGSTSSYASHAPVIGWGGWETFSLGAPIYSDRFRVNTDFGYGEVDQIQVDVSLDNVTWTTAYTGAAADATWDARTFAAQNVQFARFRYHRLTTIYSFWLYEFNFYETPPLIVPPTVDTTPATSIEETTAVLHGSITASGGNPCEAWFEWGTVSGVYPNSTTPHRSGLGTGSTFGKLITNVAGGTVYYRAAASNSAGVGYGPERSFTHGPPRTGWISPSNYSDPSSAWSDEENVYDDELDTFARSFHDIGDPDGQWSPYLILTHASMECNGLRFYAKDDPNIDSAEVDISSNGTTWTNVFAGAFTDVTWMEAWFTRQTVIQARIRFHVASNDVGLWWELYEFDFHRVVQITVSGTRDNPSVPVSLLVRGVASGADSNVSGTYSIAAWMGNEDPLLIYDDNNVAGNDAAIVTLADTSANMTGLNLAASTLILTNNFGSAITNADISAAKGASADTDIPYTWSGLDITISSGIALTIASGKTYAPGGNLTLPGNFTNNGSFTATTGTVTFNGNTMLSGSGAFTFNNATISGTLVAGARAITVSGNWTNNGTFTATGSTVEFNGSTNIGISGTGTLNFNGLTINKSTVTTTVTPTTTLSVGGPLTITQGTLPLSTNTNTAGVVTLVNGSITGTRLTGDSYNVQNGTVSASLRGGGSVSLTKTTTGTVTLSGANAYTGSTTVSAGTLLVNGSLAAGAGTTIVSDGATLGGTGTVRAISVAPNGIVSPGDPSVSSGIGTLTATSADFSAGGALVLQVNSLASFDRLAMTGALTLDGNSMLRLSSVPTVNGSITSVITFGSLLPTTSARFAFIDNPSTTMGAALNYNGGVGPINMTFSNSNILAIAWATGTTDSNGVKLEGDITAANWILGSVNLSAIRTTHSTGSDPTINFVVRNTGGVNESFTVTCANSAAWTLASAIGNNQFEAGVNTDDSAVYNSLVGGRVIQTSAFINAARTFDLRFAAPTDTSTGATQNIRATVTASAP